MRLFMPPLDIGDEEGFSADKDLFGRKSLGLGLTNLITTVSQPMVIALDAQWGSGKTTFLKMWAGELRKEKIPVIYFDAFENDYIADAFAAIAGQMITLAREKKKERDGSFVRFRSSAISTGKVLARSALKIGVKLGTAGALEAGDLGSIAKDLGDEAANLTDKQFGEMLTKQKEQKETITQFRESLAELPGMLSDRAGPEHEQSETSAKPLVVIIDELDRCRPSFALEVLERIKHFFSVENVHFVLGVHLGQLENSVSATYGSNINAPLYLQKFISFPIYLIDDPTNPDSSSISRYCNFVAQKLELPLKERQEYIWMIERIAVNRSMSLRTIEKIFSNIAMTLAFSGENRLRPWPIIAGLSAMRVDAPKLYSRAKLGTLDYAGASEIIFLHSQQDADPNQTATYIAEVWKYVTGSPQDDAHREYARSIFLRYQIHDHRKILPIIANRIMDQFVLPQS
jgi:hypothetical protein